MLTEDINELSKDSLLRSLETICFIMADYYGKDDAIDVAIAIAASPFRHGNEPIENVLARIKTNYV